MLSANDFSALEERVLRAVSLVRSERQARIAAEERASSLETQLHSLEAQIQQIEAQSPILERLVQEVESLRIEREQVRQRVERLLGQLDALEL
jgi:regulator of replication initiation timing